MLLFAFPEQLGHQKRTERPLRRRRRSLWRFQLERIPLVGIDHLCFPTLRTAWDAAVVEVNVSMHKVLRLKLSQHGVETVKTHMCGVFSVVAAADRRMGNDDIYPAHTAYFGGQPCNTAFHFPLCILKRPRLVPH